MSAKLAAAEADPASLLEQALEADRLAEEAERVALGGDLSVTLEQITEHRDRATSLRFRARSARARQERDAADKRAKALAALHSEITERARQIEAGSLNAALEAVREAAETFMTLVADHSAAVAEFRERAHGLGARGFLPSGPDPANGHIATSGAGVTAGDVSLRLIRPEDARELAVRAAGGERVRVPQAALVEPPRHRPQHVLMNGSGGVITLDQLGSGTLDQLGKGDVIELTPRQVDDFMAGRLQVTPAEFAERRKVQMSMARAQAATHAADVARQQMQAQLAMGA